MPELDLASIRRIANVVRRVELTPRDEIARGKGPVILPYCRIGITTTPIKGRVGKTPGVGWVQPYLDEGPAQFEYGRGYAYGYGEDSTLVPFGPPTLIKNWTGSVVAAGIWVKFVVLDGKLYLDGTDCSGVAP